MVLRCPHGGAGVHLEAEAVADGDGVWARSGLAAGVVSVDARGRPACAGGCPLTAAPTAALAHRAAEADVLGAAAEEREAAEARADLTWAAWRNH
jgi:hypothetical protein